MLFSIVAEPIYIPRNSVQEFLFLHVNVSVEIFLFPKDFLEYCQA